MQHVRLCYTQYSDDNCGYAPPYPGTLHTLDSPISIFSSERVVSSCFFPSLLSLYEGMPSNTVVSKW